MSKREELRQRRQQQAKRQQTVILVVIVLAALTVTGVMIYPNLQPVGDIVTIEKENYPLADGAALGPSTAKVVVQVFSDFQCPFCQKFALGAEQQLIDQYIPTGQVRLEYRHFIVVDGNVGGAESRRAAEASACAAAQDEFWNFHALTFTNQNGEGLGAFSDRRLKAFAETLELDTAAFNACFDSRQFAADVQADEQLARSLGVNSTPTVFVNGTRVQNPLDFAEFQTLIEAGLAQ
jgi:protein-disulfide isomerase